MVNIKLIFIIYFDLFYIKLFQSQTKILSFNLCLIL
jgi:hypothetical protein